MRYMQIFMFQNCMCVLENEHDIQLQIYMACIDVTKTSVLELFLSPKYAHFAKF